MSTPDLAGVRPDPDLMQPRDGANPGPDCPSCSTFSTRLGQGRFWCANIRCDAVFRVDGLNGLVVVGRVARTGDRPVVILPTRRARDTGPRLGDPLGAEAPISADGLTWHALRVETGREEAVKDDLGMMRLVGYVPVRTKMVRVKRRAQQHEERDFPILPGYVLLGVWEGYTADWPAICDIDHVIGPVGIEGTPSRLPAGEVRELLLREASGEFRASERTRRGKTVLPSVKPGDMVKVGGPFEHTAEIIGIDGIYATLKGSPLRMHLGMLRRVS